MILFINPPQWYPMSPYSAQAILAGQLNGRGYAAKTADYNVDFFNDILTNEFVSASLKKARDEYGRLSARLPEEAKALTGVPAGMPRSMAVECYRYKILNEYFKSNTDAVHIANSVDSSVAVMKNREAFYNPELLFPAKDVLARALEIVSLPFAPARIMLDNYIANPLYTYDYADIKAQCCDKSVNMFIEYFEKKLAAESFEGIDSVGISITDLSQMIPGFTLAKQLKEKGLRVNFGGNYIYKIREDVKSFPEIFEIFCDSMSVGDGETAAVEYAGYINGERDISEVHSLMYLKNEVVVANETAERLNLDAVFFPDFDSYDFKKYFSPDTVMPVQLGKGCYWGKCTFCDFYTGQQSFDMKSVCRAADEVEYLQKKYGVKHFTFVDEAVPPKFYAAFADEIIKRKLEIYYYSFARLEKAFTREILKKLYDSGAHFFMWGYEAESERIMKLINKGVDLAERQRILRDAREAGLWNHCTFLLCYPTETPAELQSTIDVIYDRELVNSCTPSNFALKKNSILKNDIGSVGITQYSENGSFHISYKYESNNMSMKQVKDARNTFEHKFIADTASSLWSLTFTDSDHLLLYLAKHGRDWVYNYKLEYKKHI